MDAPVPPTQVDSLSEIQNESIKSDTRPNRLGTEPDVGDAVITSNGEANDAQPESVLTVTINGGPLSKVCKTRKANVHEAQGGRTIKVNKAAKTQ